MGQLKEKAKEEKYTLANLPKLTSFLTRASCPASANISPVSGGFTRGQLILLHRLGVGTDPAVK